MPFVWNEDRSIRAKLSGITVLDPAGGTSNVVTYFRLPEPEARDKTYPQIIIDPAVIQKADEREHRGPIYLPYVPEQYSVGGGVDPVVGLDRDNQVTTSWDPATSPVDQSPFYVQDYPIPFDFDYTITVETRLQIHLTNLMLLLSGIDYLPARFGYLEVPADGTVRSLFLIGGPHILPTRDVDGKRLFSAMYKVRVPSELTTYQYNQILSGDLVHNVNLTLEEIPGD